MSAAMLAESDFYDNGCPNSTWSSVNPEDIADIVVFFNKRPSPTWITEQNIVPAVIIPSLSRNINN